MRKIYLFLTLIILLLPGLANAQVILAWQFANGYDAGNSNGREATAPSTTTNANVEVSILKRGAGMGVPTGNNVRTFNGVLPANGTKNDALQNERCYEFAVKAKSGYKLNLSALDVTLRRASATAAKTYKWYYSKDGINFTDIAGTADRTYTGTSAGGDAQATISLSGVVDLQGIPSNVTVTFRMYAWGATAADVQFAIGKSTNSAVDPSNALALSGAAVL